MKININLATSSSFARVFIFARVCCTQFKLLSKILDLPLQKTVYRYYRYTVQSNSIHYHQEPLQVHSATRQGRRQELTEGVLFFLPPLPPLLSFFLPSTPLPPLSLASNPSLPFHSPRSLSLSPFPSLSVPSP